MQTIRLLDNKTINKIAAGEVVESPRSVVKELVENAIDAGASHITVEIREGGMSYIRISDNGSGIPKEQVKEAFMRHATSKMTQIEDLEQIFTLGFRGEALASIAAVSQLEMLSKTRDEGIGTQIEIHGGVIRKFEDTVCTDGTSILIKNLFYNVPARKKFLKRPTTESSHVSELIYKMALGHPEVSFRYINNEVTILHTSGNNDIKTAVFYVYGKEAANQMIPLSFQKDEFSIQGLIGKPELSRGNRNYENLFINGRFIKNSVVSSAVEDAYKTRLMVGKFPVFVLNFTLSPASVDVNVHPAKLEVRFKNDDEIYDLFYNAVIKTLDEQILIPRVEWDKKPKQKDAPVVEQQELGLDVVQTGEKAPAVPEEKTIEPIRSFAFDRKSTDASGGKSVNDLLKRSGNGLDNGANDGKIKQPATAFLTKEPTDEKTLVDTPETLANVPSDSKTNVPEVPEKAKTVLNVDEILKSASNANAGVASIERIEQPTSKHEPFFKNYKIVGQLFRTYWVIEQGQSMYMIDQHAAHERILFEEFMNRFKEENIVSQRLLTPLMLNLNEVEKETLRENMELLKGFGFEIESFPGDSYAILSMPYLLKDPDGVGYFTDILDRLTEEKIGNAYDTKLMAIATMACKAAVKGHDSMSFQEAEAMITRLLKLENPFSCPHGRPTIIEMTQYELEKKFKRIQD